MRRYDIDWLRVIVFIILIFYHVGMFFIPWDWHIKNNVEYDLLKLPMIFVSQWRLPILFLISGIGTFYALSEKNSLIFIKERFIKLLIPLAVGMIFIVPPQVYIERVAYGGYTENYWKFFLCDAFKGVYPEGNLSWHHLWFLPYLLFYSIISAPFFIYLRDNKRFKQLISKLFARNLIFKTYILSIPLTVFELILLPKYPSTHDFINDYYNHSKYLLLFIYGFLLVSMGNKAWELLKKKQYVYLVTGIVSFCMLWTCNIFYSELLTFFPGSVLVLNLIKAPLGVISMWSFILSILGFAYKYLNRPGKALKYSSEAVYPFYIIHQTITIIIGYFIMDYQWPFLLKFSLMVIGTFSITWIIYEYLIRRFKIIRPIFGLKYNFKNQ